MDHEISGPNPETPKTIGSTETPPPSPKAIRKFEAATQIIKLKAQRDLIMQQYDYWFQRLQANADLIEFYTEASA